MTSANDRPTPLDAQRRSRGPECLSDLTLDRRALGEVPDGEREAMDAHLASCAGCARASEALAADRARFAAEAAIPTLAADALERTAPARAPMWLRLRRWLVPLAAGLAGATALGLWVAPPEDGGRTKGAFALVPYVLHPEIGATGALHGGEPLHPGDQLQFRASSARAGHLAIVAVDDRGEVSVYYPPGPHAAPVPAGRDVALGSAVELDGTLGREVIVGVRCEAALPVADVVAAARKAAAARAPGGEPGPLGLPCAETRHQIWKRERPIR